MIRHIMQRLGCPGISNYETMHNQKSGRGKLLKKSKSLGFALYASFEKLNEPGRDSGGELSCVYSFIRPFFRIWKEATMTLKSINSPLKRYALDT